jgi:hypothetical protein
LTAAKLLADATARMVEAAKVNLLILDTHQSILMPDDSRSLSRMNVLRYTLNVAEFISLPISGIDQFSGFVSFNERT